MAAHLTYRRLEVTTALRHLPPEFDNDNALKVTTSGLLLSVSTDTDHGTFDGAFDRRSTHGSGDNPDEFRACMTNQLARLNSLLSKWTSFPKKLESLRRRSADKSLQMSITAELREAVKTESRKWCKDLLTQWERFGKQSRESLRSCWFCGVYVSKVKGTLMVCKGCDTARYCSKKCQRQ